MATDEDAPVRQRGDGLGSKAYVGFFLVAWIGCSVTSLFYANTLLKETELKEDLFTMSQLGCSVVYGLLLTKVLRLHKLTAMSPSHVRAVVPLSIAYLVKELLKYASLGRISVNLFNTIRSSGPVFSVLLEIVFLKHFPTTGMIAAMVPIVGGVTATSLDEMRVSFEGAQIMSYTIGLVAAVISTGINNAQNIYSKILFGQKRFDPVSLQIYLSGVSLVLLVPLKALASLSSGGLPALGPTHFPDSKLCLQLALCGFVNFLSSQLAFSTLRLISPVSYSVSNTFKRIVITVVAVAVYHERLSPLNGLGIAASIVGVFVYERAVRSYKQAHLYEQGHEASERV